MDPDWYSAKNAGSGSGFIKSGSETLVNGTYSLHQCSAWIRRHLHTCRYRNLLGSADTYIPVVPAVFRIRIQSGQWIRIWIDIQLKCWMDLDSQNGDLRNWVPVPTHVVSAAPGCADIHIPVGTGTYSPRQCSAWIRRYLHTCRYR